MSQKQAVPDEPLVKTDDRSIQQIGYVILLFTFGFLGTWSYFAPIDNAVVAPGFVTVKYNSKTVQHLEGGIIKRILVHEGSKVESGDILIEFDDTAMKAAIAQLKSQYVALHRVKKSNQHLENSFQDEITELKALLVEGFASKQDLRERQRQHANAQGTLAEITAEIESIIEKLRIREDTLERSLVRAPVTGTVLNLEVHTVGGVIRQGGRILDIVPDGQALVITAKVPPVDIDRMSIGLNAEIRLSAFNQITTPKVYGTVINVSADKLIDEATGLSYYQAQLDLLPESVEALVGLELVPGMPADVLISTGERTLLQYLSKPITDSFARSFLEE
jgi:epimerase transport system membrane fusion protein|tara:strand:- start:8285 stop:9286 length:1002 start_codon:yes stop_codon:yes gene_type:complete